MDAALGSTRYIDSDSEVVSDFVSDHAGDGDEISKAVNLYYALRDSIRYDMRSFSLDEDLYVASKVIGTAGTFCVPKAIALAATARAAGIPARLGFANVRNHMTSPRLAELMDGDVFHWHAYTSLCLDGQWVKATPAFDLRLCERYGVLPLEFNGREDSIFHPYDREGREHMEYVNFIGEFDDLPYGTFAAEMRTHHLRMLEGLEADRAALRKPGT